MSAEFHGVVLDLDDTLIDTTRLLVPAADRRAAGALIAHGAPADEEGLLARFGLLRRQGVVAVFEEVAREYGLPAQAAEAAEDTFFRYDVPDLQLTAQVVAALAELREIAPLALLTFGDLDTQWSKIRTLGLDAAGAFAALRVVARRDAGGKAVALAALLNELGWAPVHVVMCGDNPASDIRAANTCGCISVRVRRDGAEFARAGSDVPLEQADHEIGSVTELPALLRRLG